MKHGQHNLVVLGVSLRPSETLYFGNTATTVLRNAECSVMLWRAVDHAQPTA
jgi:nucleotide-binding universal stress UspA family protein